MSYSKGPWFVVEDTDQVDEFGNGPTHIAISKYEDDVADAIAWMHEGTTEDAHLIASAPAMYEALKVALNRMEVVHWVDSVGDHGPDNVLEQEIEMVKKAIQQAEGGEQ